MTIFLEADNRLNWLPGYFSAPLAGKRFRRVWWLWFAVGWVAMPLDEYGDYLRGGNAEWMK